MKIVLRGFSEPDFVTDDGSRVKGTKLFYTCPEDGVTGEVAADVFVRTGKVLPKLVVGSSYNADFSRKGKFMGLTEG